LAGLLGETGAKIRAMSIPVRALVLFGISSVPGLIAAACVFDGDDFSRFNAVVLASLVCTTSAVVALVLSLIWYGTPNGVIGALAGMIIGLGMPLATAVLAQRQEGNLAQAGYYGWVVLFFLFALTVKTLLLAPGINRVDPQSSSQPQGPYQATGSFQPAEPYASQSDPNSPAKKSGV
jgi:hypothetical protein